MIGRLRGTLIHKLEHGLNPPPVPVAPALEAVPETPAEIPAVPPTETVAGAMTPATH